jgi:hypothetical protein
MATEDVLRRVALALPEAVEEPTWGGDPGFKVRNKLFAHLYGDGRVSLRIDRADREALLAAAPDKFACSAPKWPFIEVTLAAVDADELAELVTDAWREVAPKRLVDTYDVR